MTASEKQRSAAKALADFSRLVSREYRKLFRSLLGSTTDEPLVQAYGRVSGLVREIQTTALRFWLQQEKPEEVESWLEREVIDLLDDDFHAYTVPSDEMEITEEGIMPKQP